MHVSSDESLPWVKYVLKFLLVLYHADLASLAVAGSTVMLTVDIYME